MYVEFDLFGDEITRPQPKARKPVRQPAPPPAKPVPPPPQPPQQSQPVVQDSTHAARLIGAVKPLLTATGAPYPRELRVQQVGLAVAKAVVSRIDAALAGGPIRLKDTVLGEAGKALLKDRLVKHLLLELYADPIPDTVKPAGEIRSRKAVGLLDTRLHGLFAAGRLDLPGVTLTSGDCYELIQLLASHILAEDQAAG